MEAQFVLGVPKRIEQVVDAWLLWVIASAVGCAVGGFLIGAYGPIAVVLLGAAVGIAQWFVLCLYFSEIGWWVLASTLGLPMGAAIGAVADWPPALLAVGVPVGIMQWFLLRPHTPPAAWWVLASTLGWALAFGVGTLLGIAKFATPFDRFGLYHESLNPILDVSLMFGVAGATAGMVTGSALVWLLQRAVVKPSAALYRMLSKASWILPCILAIATTSHSFNVARQTLAQSRDSYDDFERLSSGSQARVRNATETARTVLRLRDILHQHRSWLVATDYGRQHDSSEWTKRLPNLLEAKRANLTGANLTSVDLRGEELSHARLDLAHLNAAHLTGTTLRAVSLTGAFLYEAHLNGADLTGADLTGADLTRAQLRGADLTRVNLADTRVQHANLTGAIFEPTQNPPIESIANARNLDRLRYNDNPKPLSELRKAFKDAGFRTAERQVTAALRRHKPRLWETVLFDWTCEFGANTARPLLIAAHIWLISTMVYWISLHQQGRSGLYLLASGKKINTGNDRLHVRRLRFRAPPHKDAFRWPGREWHALATAALFSLMSTLNIGFRDFNFGRWIRMLQPREFDIAARGWPRVVSGLQALLSLGMVALSLLGYFGRPFEE